MPQLLKSERRDLSLPLEKPKHWGACVPQLESSPLATTRERPCTAMKTQHHLKKKKRIWSYKFRYFPFAFWREVQGEAWAIVTSSSFWEIIFLGHFISVHSLIHSLVESSAVVVHLWQGSRCRKSILSWEKKPQGTKAMRLSVLWAQEDTLGPACGVAWVRQEEWSGRSMCGCHEELAARKMLNILTGNWCCFSRAGALRIAYQQKSSSVLKNILVVSGLALS